MSDSGRRHGFFFWVGWEENDAVAYGVQVVFTSMSRLQTSQISILYT